MTASLLQVPTLVVEQRRKLFELNNQYRIFDTGGTQIGVVEQVGQSFLTLLARIGTDLDVALPVTLQVLDAAGSPGPVDTQTLVLDAVVGLPTRRSHGRFDPQADPHGQGPLLPAGRDGQPDR